MKRYRMQIDRNQREETPDFKEGVLNNLPGTKFRYRTFSTGITHVHIDVPTHYPPARVEAVIGLWSPYGTRYKAR